MRVADHLPGVPTIRLFLLLAVALALPSAPAPATAQDVAPRYTADSVRTARARGGMVVSENALASEIGRDVLAAGGNAVDAAVADTRRELTARQTRLGELERQLRDALGRQQEELEALEQRLTAARDGAAQAV